MSARFLNLDRQSPMLLPCDWRDWVPADPIVHFILDAVEELPRTHFHVNHRGTGSQPDPPAMMLALLIYSYANAQAAVEKHSHHQSVADLLPQPDPAAPGPQAGAQEVMAHRLQRAAGKTLYKLRKPTVEPVFGIIKEVMGFRQFLLRGRAKVELEWTLVCVSYNLKRLFRLKHLMAAG